MLRRSLLLVLAPLLLLVAACGNDADPADDAEGSTTEAPGPDPADEAALESVEAEPGEEGAAPTLVFDQPFAVSTTVRRVLEPGSGDAAADGSTVVFDFVFVNGRDGAEVSSSYGIEPATVTVDGNLLAGVRIGLTGAQAGEQALVAIAPADGFAGQGDDEETGVREDDTLLLFIDVQEVRTPLQRAEGEPVEPVDGLPAVELDEDGKPTITVPDGEPPTELVAQPLIEGEGAVVEAGQQLTVHYTGVLWDGGEQFDSSWDRGSPATFPIGTGGVIDGWDEGLVGRTIGSQVLLVIPPDKGYGDAGQGSIPGGATLVFVVDILDAR
ncbi:MAG: FKBP-type peptidyl-prolyl cis-trans isomerase [Actinomycetota bacterium]